MLIRAFLFNIIFAFGVIQTVCSSCVFQDGKYDLLLLDRSSPWPVAGTDGNGSYHYEISLCRPLNYTSEHLKGCSNSSICLVSKDNAVSYGNAINNTSDYAIADYPIDAGFSLYVLTRSQCKGKGVYRATINFACGPNLGAPELSFKSDCQANFFWRTSAACSQKPNNRQVPCYVLDQEGRKRDLSPLIKDVGGYNVINPFTDAELVINVCSDVVIDDPVINCPKNISACRISGNEFHSFGSVAEGVEYTPEGLLLAYKTDSPVYPSDCRLKPKTTVLFKCPERGFSQLPKLISNANCQYEVVWETEYACPESLLKGDLKTCQFTQESHGVEIDLSPLRQVQMYNVSAPASSSYFLLSVCGGLGGAVSCSGQKWKHISVCSFNTSTGMSQIAGTTNSAELVYADHDIVLRYRNGSPCNGTEQMTAINFVCDANATNNGIGEPKYISSFDNCSHVFEWHTKHACLKQSLDIPCSVSFGKKTVNLEALSEPEGSYWTAVDYKNLGPPGYEFIMNVCGSVSEPDVAFPCGSRSSACAVNRAKNSSINLGSFASAPVYDEASDSIRLTYAGGSPCSGGSQTWHASIDFICKPGFIISEPYLVRIDETDCHYKFEWPSSHACPVAVIEGSNCKVFDSTLGFVYDLTPLKSKVYKTESKEYEFYLGVCEPVKDSPCSSSDKSKNVGVCQVSKSNKKSWNTGEPSSKLSYIDGVINLTYMSGDTYNDANKTSRVTIILFICDQLAGTGSPRFIEEVNFSYMFHWYTSLVCPPKMSSECVVRDEFSGITYDLSELSTTHRNWNTIVNEDGKTRKLYLNVCRLLTAPTVCDSKAAACLVESVDTGEEKALIPNLGKPSGSPTLISPGHLSLTYTNGDFCVAYGENTTFTTTVHFLCPDDRTTESGLQFLSKVGACEYSLLWSTLAACPSAELKSNGSCQLTDPESGFVFDLSPLHKSKHPYTADLKNGDSFLFNICGKVEEGCEFSEGSKQSKNVSVCEVDSNGNFKSSIAVSDGFNLSFYNGRDLTLTYMSTAAISKEAVVIKFPCYNSSVDSSPKLLSYENGLYVFELKTSLTCVPEHFDCNVVDQFGNEYDFSPLARQSNGNWEVSDSRPGFSDIRYHINFCRPLNKFSTYKCPGRSSSACQTNLVDPESTGHDLGSIMSEPVVSSKGTVVIRYTGGSFCHNGQFTRSTTINLFCSPEEGELKFMGETPECEYVFSLDTPYACPIQSTRGSSCQVKDPVFGYMFDLNPLKNKNSYYNVTVGEYLYAFNVCDKLNGLSNRCENSSACQLKPKDPGFSKSLGLPNDKIVYRKGLISLEYESGTGNCHGKYNRTTKITFTCHHAHEDKDGPTFIAEAQDCTYLFEWPTVHACPPFDVIECSVVDSRGVTYDLSKLSLPNTNYYVKNPMSDKKTFVINVCRSVVHTPDSLCPYTAAACLIDSSKPEPINLGRVAQSPYIEDGKIKIRYTTGDPCDEGGSSARFMETIIEFICDPTMIDSEPEFIGVDSCTNYFDWHTAYACESSEVLTSTDCTAKDPFTGYVFNFTSLQKHGLYEVKNGNHQYSLSVCSGGGGTSSCGPNAGMCQEELSGQKRHWSGGISNSNLTFSNGMLYLNYSHGDSCHGGQYERNTLIEFHCGHGIGEPEFLYESHDCTYFFIWKTELACQTLMHCAIKNGSLYYDLTPLSSSYHTAASTVVDDSASYYISVCNTLESIPGVFCPPGAAICRLSKNPETGYTISESLGKVEHPPMVDFMGHATVLYTNGSICEKNPQYRNRARIIFLCAAKAGIGEPILLEHSDDCFFLFEWRTSVVCPAKPEVPSAFTSCNYTDNSKGIHFDLSPLQRTGNTAYYEVFEGSTMSFKLNICADLRGLNISNCGDAGVCGQSGNVVSHYGVAASQKFTYDGRRLRLTFYDGDDCPSGLSGKRTSEIFFVCDPMAGMGEPILHKHYTCLVVFMWKTALVCQNAPQKCAFDVDGQHYDINLLSSLSHNWVINTDNKTFWINLCQGIQPTTETLGCPPAVAVCMRDQYGNRMSLGGVQSMKVKSMNSSDLLLSFDHGDSRACQNVGPALVPVTRLFMRCGRSLGQPRLMSGPDSQCFYNFVWESSLACANKAEVVLIEKEGIIQDKRFDFSFDINEILNRTFIVSPNSTNESYVYKINLSGGVSQNLSDPTSTCAKAAVCQTKPKADPYFERDIGSFATRTFIVRGSELHLVFKSLSRGCGKNPSKEVTTLVNMQCVSSAEQGNPQFLYESGNCDYVFEWPTVVVCPPYDRRKSGGKEPDTNAYKEIVSHKGQIVGGVIFAFIAALIIIFILYKPQRRAAISSKFRGLFGNVNWPYFRYKRCDGERLVLVDASQIAFQDDDLLHC